MQKWYIVGIIVIIATIPLVLSQGFIDMLRHFFLLVPWYIYMSVSAIIILALYYYFFYNIKKSPLEWYTDNRKSKAKKKYSSRDSKRKFKKPKGRLDEIRKRKRRVK